MVVCNNCARLGKQIGPSAPARERGAPHVQGFLTRERASPVQGGFRTMTQPKPSEPDFEVDPDYNSKIKQAREKLGLSQEQLGMLLNEKPSVIKMVESRKLKPDIALTRKLMHQLKINLLVSLSELEGGRPTGI
jgi:uncharacterized protein (TIGR00270 family)